MSQASGVILRIREHRAVLPGAANPLGRYREGLEALIERRDPYASLAPGKKSERRDLAKKIMGDADRLEVLVALLDGGAKSRGEIASR